MTSKSQADRLITDPDEPLPTDLARREQQALKDRAERLEKQRERDEQEKVKKAFSNPWPLETEKEMAENNMRLERGAEPDMSATLTSLLEIDCEKLGAFHEKQGTLRLQMAVEKRKEICVKRGLVDPRYASSVRDVYSSKAATKTCPNQRLQTTMVIRQRHHLTTRLRTRTRRCLLHLRARRPSNRRARTCSLHRRHLVTSPHLMKAFAQALHHYWGEYPHLTTDLRSEQDSREAKQPRGRSGWLAQFAETCKKVGST